MQPPAADSDVGSQARWAAVPAGADPQPVRKFGAFTADLQQPADWLQRRGIQAVVMESTEVHWIPLFELLKRRPDENRPHRR